MPKPLAHAISRTVSIAPMMDYTDRYYRYFMRLLTRHTLLYTEMITAAAILHGDRQQLLQYDPSEHPLALQLGGNDPDTLAECAAIAADFGYDEVNLNVGCPSNRVADGHFGACLMKEPALVARCVAAMRQRVTIPVTVKCRIGVDDQDSYEHLHGFISAIASEGCEVFIIHARKAWLNGLSPKENRTIPPLQYEVVYQLKQDFPKLQIVINGGIQTIEQIRHHLTQVDGVMIGRQAYQDNYLFATIDGEFYNDLAPPSARRAIIEKMLPFISAQLAQGVPLSRLTRHMLGMFHGVAGGRSWRRYLSQYAHFPTAGVEVVEAALREVL